ncbi:MAG: hypothetical protein JNJ45_05205 [Chthonomonas sp.]|nr:hypothetical protein [Chthonomonas sp.]
MRLRFLTPWLLIVAGCGGGGGTSAKSPVLDAFHSTFKPYLAQDLWTETEIGDAGTWLAVPAIYAARTNNGEIMAEYRKFFDRMLDSITELPSSDVHRIQFAYLIAVFIGEAHRHGLDASIPPKLPEFAAREFKRLWNEKPAWQWVGPGFPGGIQEKVNWKLAAGPTSPSYLRVINDDEMLTMCTAAELVKFARETGKLGSFLADLETATELGVATVKVRGEDTSEGGWLFNRGLWYDHQDFEYSSYTTPPDPYGYQNGRRANVAEPISNSMRLGAWLQSLQHGAQDSEDVSELRRIRGRMAWQILNRVAKKNPTNPNVRLAFTNYMDGHNGYYQYRSNSQPGFEPSALSGTPFMGWWGMLGGSSIGAMYDEMASMFPLSSREFYLYSIETNQYRNPAVRDPASFYSGLRWMVCKMAAEIAVRE